MFPNEHPDYALRRLEHQQAELKKLARTLEGVDPGDPVAMKDALLKVVGSLAEVTSATGSVAQWIRRKL